jgi:hypothetical protein
VAFDQLEQHVEPGLGRQIGVEFIVGLLSFFEAPKNASDSVHGVESTTPESRWTALRGRAGAGSSASSAGSIEIVRHTIG